VAEQKFLRLPPAPENQLRLVHKALYEAIGRRKNTKDLPEDERRKMRAEAEGMKRFDNKVLRTLAMDFIGEDQQVC